MDLPQTVGASSGKGKNDKEANCTKKTQHCATKLSLNQLYKLTLHTTPQNPNPAAVHCVISLYIPVLPDCGGVWSQILP